MTKHITQYIKHKHAVTEYYRDDKGVFRWNSNKAVCPLDACRDYGIADLPGYDKPTQEAARSAETRAFVEAYRKTPRVYSPEQKAEMRNVFGPGAKVINIITGQVIPL